MRILFAFFIIIASILFGCTTTSKQSLPAFALTPPDLQEGDSVADSLQKLDQYLELGSSRPVFLWAQYNRARLLQDDAPTEACDIYSALSSERHFPLSRIALLRAHKTCPVGVALPDIDYSELIKEKWLKPLVLETGLKIALESDSEIDAMNIYVEQSRISIIRPEKIALMKKALAIAKKNQLKDEIRRFNKRLYWLSPRLNPSPRLNERLKVAGDLRRSREFSEARRLYEKVISDSRSGTDEIYKALNGIRLSYKLERKKEDFLRASKNMTRFVYKVFRRNKKKHSRLYLDTVLLYTRTLWTDGQVTKAKRLLSNVAREVGRYQKLSTVFWLQARISEEEKKYPLALYWLNRAEKACKKTCSLRNQIRWYQAWNLRKLKKLQKAEEILYSLMIHDESRQRPRYTFWLAKTKDDLGQKEEADQLYRDLLRDDPIGYYGLLAHRELGLPIGNSMGRNLASVSTDKMTFSQTEDGTLASWLIAVGEKELAKNFLNQKTKEYLKTDEKSIAFWSEIASFYARTGAYVQLFQVLGRLQPELRRAILSFQPHLVFPQPFQEIVQSSSEKYGVLPEIIYSIMRQESAFNRKARSHADAFGLMQLLPSVAAKTARQARVPFEKADDLYSPDINIPLGSAHLRELWDRFDGQFLLLTASYNASEKAIRNWVKYRYEGDPLQFIEDIPYKETQGYIKLVLRNLVFYKKINADGAAIPFPEWCLKDIQSLNI